MAQPSSPEDWASSPTTEYVGLPLFSCAWLDSDQILLGGGGGMKGTGVSSGVFIASFDTARDSLVFHSFVDSLDDLVYSMTACGDTVYFSAEDRIVVMKVSDLGARALGSFTSDFAEDEAFQMAAAVSPDGTLLVTGGEERVIRLWRHPLFPTPEPACAYPGHTKAIKCAVLNCDSSLAASTSLEAECFIWSTKRMEMSTLNLRHVSRTKGKVSLIFRGCRFDKNNPKILYTWMNESVRGPSFLVKWNVVKGSVISKVPVSSDPICQGEISPQGHIIAVATNSAQLFLYDTQTMVQCNRFRSLHEYYIYAYAIITNLMFSMPITGISFSPSGHRILTVSGDQSYEISKVSATWGVCAWMLLCVFVTVILFLIMLVVLPEQDLPWVSNKV